MAIDYNTEFFVLMNELDDDAAQWLKPSSYIAGTDIYDGFKPSTIARSSVVNAALHETSLVVAGFIDLINDYAANPIQPTVTRHDMNIAIEGALEGLVGNSTANKVRYAASLTLNNTTVSFDGSQAKSFGTLYAPATVPNDSKSVLRSNGANAMPVWSTGATNQLLTIENDTLAWIPAPTGTSSDPIYTYMLRPNTDGNLRWMTTVTTKSIEVLNSTASIRYGKGGNYVYAKGGDNDFYVSFANIDENFKTFEITSDNTVTLRKRYGDSDATFTVVNLNAGGTTESSASLLGTGALQLKTYDTDTHNVKTIEMSTVSATGANSLLMKSGSNQYARFDQTGMTVPDIICTNYSNNTISSELTTLNNWTANHFVQVYNTTAGSTEIPISAGTYIVRCRMRYQTGDTTITIYPTLTLDVIDNAYCTASYVNPVNGKMCYLHTNDGTLYITGIDVTSAHIMNIVRLY